LSRINFGHFTWRGFLDLKPVGPGMRSFFLWFLLACLSSFSLAQEADQVANEPTEVEVPTRTSRQRSLEWDDPDLADAWNPSPQILNPAYLQGSQIKKARRKSLAFLRCLVELPSHATQHVPDVVQAGTEIGVFDVGVDLATGVHHRGVVASAEL
jgi:hypothetical protein